MKTVYVVTLATAETVAILSQAAEQFAGAAASLQQWSGKASGQAAIAAGAAAIVAKRLLEETALMEAVVQPEISESDAGA